MADAIRLRLFPFSLLGKAKQWFYQNKEAVSTWDKCSMAFLTKFFPLGKTNALHGKISSFQQTGMESMLAPTNVTSDDARRCQFGVAVFYEPRINPQAHGILL